MTNRPVWTLAMAMWLATAAWSVISASQNDGAPAFAVASVKRVPDPAGRLYRFRITPGGALTASTATLLDLISRAYGVRLPRMVGLPGWANSEFYDIEARAATNASSREVMAMLRTLLATRLNVRAHVEAREVPLYALVRRDGTPGPQLRPAEAECVAWQVEVRAQSLSGVGARPSKPECEASTELRQSSAVMKFKAWTMPRFAAVVENWVGRPVQDRTGLNGEFDIEIEVGLDDLPLRRAERGAGAPPSGGPSLVGALESQLGLALESAQGLTDMLVIVSAEREPSPN